MPLGSWLGRSFITHESTGETDLDQKDNKLVHHKVYLTSQKNIYILLYFNQDKYM